MPIPNPNQIAGRIKPKSVQVKTTPPAWRGTPTTDLKVGDVVLIGRVSYLVDRINNPLIHLVPYGVIGVGKVSPRTLDTDTTHYVKAWR